MRRIHARSFLKGRSFRQALIVPFCVALLLLASLLVMAYANRLSNERYRADNFINAQSACDTIDVVFGEAENFGLILEKDSPNAAPFLAVANRREIQSQLTDPATGFPFPFVKDSLAFNLTCCTRNLILANAHFDIAALYAPASGYYLISTGPQSTPQCYAMSSFESLKRLLSLPDSLTEGGLLANGALTFARHEPDASPTLLMTHRLENGLITLCGVSSLGLEQTVFQDVYQHGYRLEDACLLLPNGDVLSTLPGNALPMPFEALSELAGGEKNIVLLDGRIAMRCAHTNPDFTLLAFLCADKTLRLFDSNLLPPFLMVISLWLVAVSAVCLYMLFKYTRPLDELASKVSTLAPVCGETDAFSQISSAIEHFDSQMHSDRTVIAQQRQQLGNSFLLDLLLNNGRAVSAEDLEKYQIAELVTQYAVLTVTPGCGAWAEQTLSEHEQAYRTSLSLLKVENTFRSYLTGWRTASMRHRSELIIVLAATSDALPRLSVCLGKAAGEVQSQILESADFSLSALHEGAESLHAAYLETLMDGRKIGTVQPVAAPSVSMLELNQLDNRMASLIYVENYEKAFACYKAMAQLIFERETNAILRKNHLRSLITRTYCMLLESSAENARKLLPLPSYAEGLDLDNQTEFLAAFERVFAALPARECDATPASCSRQVLQVYRYMQEHFRDAELSLGLLADTFGMTASTLSREFQKNMGAGFLDLLHRLRLNAAIDEIVYTNRSLRDIAARVGYNNELTLSRAFKKYEGITPGSLRRQHPEE